MKSAKFVIVGGLAVAFVLTSAAAEGEGAAPESTKEVNGWRVSVGGNFGFGLKTNMRMSPSSAMRLVPAVPGIPRATAQSAAAKALLPEPGGARVDYGNGAFVDPSCGGGGDGSLTWNWKLPDSAHNVDNGDDYFRMSQNWAGYENVVESQRDVTGSDDGVAAGASVELSRLLYASKDGKWGVELALGLQYLRCDDCFRASGDCYSRSYDYVEGTEYVDLYTYTPMRGWGADSRGLWGCGSYDLPAGGAPSLDLSYTKTGSFSSSTTYSDSMRLSGSGDYEEWEISVLARPWYDVFDWWRLRGAIGIGVTRSDFDFAMNAALNGARIYSSSQEFDEWRCYGLVGAGTSFYLWGFDFGVDFLYRFCQEDMDINGKDVNGTLEKPDLHLRLSLGYSF